MTRLHYLIVLLQFFFVFVNGQLLSSRDFYREIARDTSRIPNVFKIDSATFYLYSYKRYVDGRLMFAYDHLPIKHRYKYDSLGKLIFVKSFSNFGVEGTVFVKSWSDTLIEAQGFDNNGLLDFQMRKYGGYIYERRYNDKKDRFEYDTISVIDRQLPGMNIYGESKSHIVYDYKRKNSNLSEFRIILSSYTNDTIVKERYDSLGRIIFRLHYQIDELDDSIIFYYSYDTFDNYEYQTCRKSSYKSGKLKEYSVTYQLPILSTNFFQKLPSFKRRRNVKYLKDLFDRMYFWDNDIWPN